MRTALLCVLFSSFAVALNGQEVKPEVVFEDGATYKYDSDFRMWSDASGNFTMHAKFDRFLQNQMVRFRRKDNDELVDVKIEILAPDDQELLAKIRKQIDAVLLFGKEKKDFAMLTKGWEEAIGQRYKYLSEMNAVYSDDALTDVQKQIELLKINERYKQAKGISVPVVMLVKSIDHRINQTGLARAGIRPERAYRTFRGVAACNHPLMQKLRATNLHEELHPWSGTPSDSTRKLMTQMFEKQINKKYPVSVGDIILLHLECHPNFSDLGFEPIKNLKSFETRKLSSFSDLQRLGFRQSVTRVKALTPEQRALLPKLDLFFDELTEKYGLEDQSTK